MTDQKPEPQDKAVAEELKGVPEEFLQDAGEPEESVWPITTTWVAEPPRA